MPKLSRRTDLPRPPSAPPQGEIFSDAPRSFAPANEGSGARRIGVVDVGSNSVRMVVFEGHCRVPEALFNEKAMCGLGAHLHRTGALDPEGAARALAALRRFAALAPGLGVGALCGIATAAIREAADGSAFRDRVERETGIRLAVASGAEEARLAAQGVLFGNPSADGLAADLGGASLEFARIRRGEALNGATMPLGPLRLNGPSASEADEGEAMDRHLREVAASCGLDGASLYLVGGSWRALARVRMIRTGHPVEVIHEFRMSRDEAETFCRQVAGETPKALAALPGVSRLRAEFLPFSARLLLKIMHWIGPGDVRFSGFGLREGLCFEHLPVHIRRQDPLIAACREQEKRRARAPGLGGELDRWVRAILPPRSPEEDRLTCAAALLSDVNWRTNPDFRAEGCWETVTRVQITDIGHEGRVWLGAALVALHKSRDRKRFEDSPQIALLNPDELERAGKLGLALRLGVALAGAAPGILGRSRIFRDGNCLILELGPEIRAFAGEEVEKRLARLARAMTLDRELRIRA